MQTFIIKPVILLFKITLKFIYIFRTSYAKRATFLDIAS
jgi:hypothetical protein